MENKYLFVVFSCLLAANLISVCGTETVTANEGETINEPSLNETSKVENNGEATNVEEPLSNVEEPMSRGEEPSSNTTQENETNVVHETTTEYDNILNETTTVAADNITIIAYYSSFDTNDTDNLTYLFDQENSTLIDFISDDNDTDVTTMVALTLNETDFEFTTVNSTEEDIFSTVNTTDIDETTLKTEERDTTQFENDTSTMESVENVTITTIAPEIITTEPTEEISENITTTSDSSSTLDTTTTELSSSINGTEEYIDETITSSNITSSEGEFTSEDINTLTPASHIKAEEDHEEKLKLFIPIGVVGILILVGFIAYFVIRKMKKTATYECEPYS